MATPALELYTPLGGTIVAQQPLREVTGTVTWWDRVMNAARIRFGPHIVIKNLPAIQNQINLFIENLLFTVVHNDPEPLMTRPTIIDVTFKEFVNLSETEKDETTIQVGKNLPIASGTRYHFNMTEGVKFDHKYNFGAQIVGLSMAGGYMSVGTKYSVPDPSYNMGLQFHYGQKEKIVIPPKTRVKAKIITSTRKFRQNYTIEFSAPRSSFFTILYYSSTQQQYDLCNCCQPSQGYLYAADVLRTLPNFKDNADGFCSFTQRGILTWIGEAYTVEKSEVPIGQ